MYTGKKIDRDTGLYYFNARWYDTGLGRFITEDPVKDGVNWFSYVYNNPLKYTDPTGLTGSIPNNNGNLNKDGRPDTRTTLTWRDSPNSKPKYIWPTRGEVTTTYNDPTYDKDDDGIIDLHPAIDIANKKGTPIVAAADGIIKEVLDNTDNYGYGVVIEHEDGVETKYGHFDKLPEVEVDQEVKQDEQIGEMGSSGLSSGPHLHYEMKVDGDKVNPETMTEGSPESSSDATPEEVSNE